VRSGVIMVQSTKDMVFWDMTQCSLVHGYKHVSETSCFNLQGRRRWRQKGHPKQRYSSARLVWHHNPEKHLLILNYSSCYQLLLYDRVEICNNPSSAYIPNSMKLFHSINILGGKKLQGPKEPIINFL